VKVPERLVVPEVIDDLPADTPEIKLAELPSPATKSSAISGW
jgi:hypothetical protein